MYLLQIRGGWVFHIGLVLKVMMIGLWSDWKSKVDSVVLYILDMPFMIAKSKSGILFRSVGREVGSPFNK